MRKMGRSHWLLFLPILAGPTFAQISYPNCSAGWDWSYNSLNQNPCDIAAYLESTCNGGQFEIPQLQPGQMYRGPDSGSGNDCQCNTVVYSLIAACSGCQGATWIQYSAWTYNCSSTASASVFPKTIPSGTRVPHWAYIDVTTSDLWNETAAQSAGDSPEATQAGPSTIQASSTSASTSTSPGPSAALHSSTSSSTNQSNSHIGAIVGGVVGAIACVALLTALVLWYLRRKRWRAEAQPTPFASTAAHMAEAFGLSDSTTIGKYYDPSDPSTFPRPLVSSGSASRTTPSTEQGHGHGADPTRPYDRTQYGGLPLV